MRAKEEKLIITFPTTTAALAMERRARELGTPGRIIPTPTVITATCGLAWMAPTDAREAVEQMIRGNGLLFERVQVLML